MTETADAIEAIAIVHIEKGDTMPSAYLVCGDERFRLFIVDENAPEDRVYEITSRVSNTRIGEVLGDSPRGHQGDDRHEAIKHRILKAQNGKPHLEVIE